MSKGSQVTARSVGLCVALLLMAAPVAAETLKGEYIAGRLVSETGFAVGNAGIKLVDPGGVVLNLSTTNALGKFQIDLDTLEDEEMDNLERFFLQFTHPKTKKTIEVQIGGWAVQDNGFIKFPTVSMSYKSDKPKRKLKKKKNLGFPAQ